MSAFGRKADKYGGLSLLVMSCKLTEEMESLKIKKWNLEAVLRELREELLQETGCVVIIQQSYTPYTVTREK